MKLRSIKKELEFIPIFNGNKDLPKVDQIKVVFSDRPTAAEIRQAITDNSVASEHVFCSKYVSRIENMEIEDDKDNTKFNKIDTYGKLISIKGTLLSIESEIGMELMSVNRFDKGEEKAST